MSAAKRIQLRRTKGWRKPEGAIVVARPSRWGNYRVTYTLSKSIDLGSAQENAGSFSGFVQNTWDPSKMRAVSSYDALHQVNAFMVWQIPVGRGRR